MPGTSFADSVGKLSDAWNELRNRALGRGTRPNVSPALAARVASEHDAWRAFAQSPGFAVDLDPWRNRFNAIRRDVESELRVSLPPAPGNVLERSAAAAAPVVEAVAKGAAWIAVASILAYAFGRGSRSRD